MSKVTVGTAAVALGYDHRNSSGGGLVVQNLGTGTIYLDTDSTVAVGTGLKVTSGSSFTFPKAPGALYAISDAAGTDVRYLLL